MILQGLIAALSRASTFDNALGYATRDADFSVTDGLRAPLLAGLIEARRAAGLPAALFVVTPTGRDSESLRTALASVVPDARIVDFPAWETLPHERLSPSAEIVGKRLAALREMTDWSGAAPLIVVASVRAALQPLADNLTDVEPVPLVAGARGHDLARLARQLVELAYVRVDMVSRRGEFAVRGGILDVFPPVAEHPYRIEFFGDELEQIREFSVADQRSIPDVVPEIALPPARELLLDDAVRQRAAEMQHEFPSMTAMLEKIANGIPVEGMESLAPALLERLVPVSHYFPAGAAVAVISPERVATRAISLSETNREFLAAAWSAATAGAQAPIDLASGEFISLGDLRDATRFSAPGAPAADHPWWTFSTFQQGPDDVLPEEREMDELLTVRLSADPVPSFSGNVDGAIDHVAERLRDGWVVAIAARGTGLVERARDVLAEREVPARLVTEFPAQPEPGIAYLLQAAVEDGFELVEAKLALISENEFYGRTVGYDSRQVKKLASRRKNVVDPLQLKAGDYVVHQTHGIGRFVELSQREVSSGGRNPTKTRREYLTLEYAPSKRGYPGTSSSFPPTSLTCSAGTSAERHPRSPRWAEATGPRPKAVRARPCVTSPSSSSSCTRPGWRRKASRSARTPRGSASSRRPSRSRRPLTS